jgi:hypothetical protein
MAVVDSTENACYQRSAMGKTALLLVDIQHDFLPPDGSLAVKDGDAILPLVYRLLDEAAGCFDLIVASLVCPSVTLTRHPDLHSIGP